MRVFGLQGLGTLCHLLFELAALLQQCPLGMLARGDVMDDALVSQHTAVSGPPHRRRIQAIHLGPVLLPALHFIVSHRARVLDGLLKPVLQLRYRRLAKREFLKKKRLGAVKDIRFSANDPHVILADEPTGNLDSGNGEQVMDLLRDLHRQGATICMVTHDPRYAQHADRIVHLFDGLIVEEEAGANRRQIEEAKQELRESGFTEVQ